MRGLTKTYVLQRVGMFLVTVWLGTTLIFIIPRLAPGDPVAAMISRMSAQAGRIENSAEIIESWRKRFGLDEPLPIQYVRYIINASTFRLGPSLTHSPSVVQHGTLPALAIVITTMGFWALGMRGMMITTDGEDYMILAQAKGLRTSRLFWLYAVRNAILPQVTALALSLGAIAGGAVIV